jgi:hypothetical protein
MGDSEARSRNLEREMDILRTLSTRTPREASNLEFAVVRAGGSGRNDAVTGSGGHFDSPGSSFRGLWNEPEDSRVLSTKFVSVGKLPLEHENPVERRSESPSRCDGGNQYSTTGSGNLAAGVEVETLVGLQQRQLEGFAPWASRSQSTGRGMFRSGDRVAFIT